MPHVRDWLLSQPTHLLLPLQPAGQYVFVAYGQPSSLLLLPACMRLLQLLKGTQAVEPGKMLASRPNTLRLPRPECWAYA